MRWSHPLPSLLETSHQSVTTSPAYAQTARSEGALAHWRRHDEWSAALHDERVSLGPVSTTRVWLKLPDLMSVEDRDPLISIPCRCLFHPSLVPTMLFVLADQVEQRRFLQISIAFISDGTRNCAALGDRTRGVRSRRGRGLSSSIAK
jgi:hypothetical protein